MAEGRARRTPLAEPAARWVSAVGLAVAATLLAGCGARVLPNRIEAASAADPHLAVTIIDTLGWVEAVRIVVPAPLPVGAGIGGLSIGNADDDQTVLRIGFLTTQCPSTVTLTLRRDGDRVIAALDGPRDACANAIGFPRLIELDLDRALGAEGVDGQDLRR